MEPWHLLIQRRSGLLTTRDASPDRLRKRAERGQLVRLLPGVYVLPHLAQDENVLIRAVAERFPDAVFGGVVAARRTYWPNARAAGPIVVYGVTTRSRVSGVDFRATRSDPADVVVADGIRCTSSPRTALDLAVQTDGRSIDEVLRSCRATLAMLWEAWAAAPGRRGNAPVRRLLLDSRDLPWSGDERMFHRALRERKVTGWSANQPVRVGESVVFPDIGFRGVRVAVEIDGRHHRDDEQTFQADRERHNALILAGWTVLHYTGAQIRVDVDAVIAQVQLVVARARRASSRNARRAA